MSQEAQDKPVGQDDTDCGSSRGYSRFTGDDACEDGKWLNAAIIVALENAAQRLRKKIIRIEHLGFAAPAIELVAARWRLEQIEQMLSE